MVHLTWPYVWTDDSIETSWITDFRPNGPIKSTVWGHRSRQNLYSAYFSLLTDLTTNSKLWNCLYYEYDEHCSIIGVHILIYLLRWVDSLCNIGYVNDVHIQIFLALWEPAILVLESRWNQVTKPSHLIDLVSSTEPLFTEFVCIQLIKNRLFLYPTCSNEFQDQNYCNINIIDLNHYLFNF